VDRLSPRIRAYQPAEEGSGPKNRCIGKPSAHSIRAHRIGQTPEVFAYRITAKDTVEEKALTLQQPD
jgi:hypothetical protein